QGGTMRQVRSVVAMGARLRASWRTLLAAATVITTVWFFGFASFSDKPGPLGTGQARITAQASRTIPGRSVTLATMPGAALPTLSSPPTLTREQLERSDARKERHEEAMAARAAGLPASDPRVARSGGPPPGGESTMRMAKTAAAPRPLVPGYPTVC